MSEWSRVSRLNPCRICDGKSWCAVSNDGHVAKCMRVFAPEARVIVDGDGNECAYYFDEIAQASPDYERKYEAEPTANRASVEVIDRVYTALSNILGISEQHIAALKKRGLSDEQISSQGYRTLRRDKRALIVQQLINAFPEVNLAEIPGFYIENGQLRLAGASGLMIPVLDLDRRIVAWKIRADQAEESKYTSLSSSSRGGPSCGAHVHIPVFSGDSSTVRVIEGEIKANVCTALTGVLTLGIPGAGTMKNLVEMLKRLNAKRVLLAFDADKSTNLHVARALKRAYELLSQSFSVSIEHWPAKAGKGLDDVIAAGKVDQVQVYSNERAVQCLDNTLERAQAEHDLRVNEKQTASKPEDKNTETPSEKTNEKPSEALQFIRADQVELAMQFLADLQRDADRPVFDRGEFWSYSAKRGIYERIPEARCKRMIANYAGSTVISTGKKPKVLHLSSGDINGAYNIACSTASSEGFFSQKRVGVAFKNGFVTIDSHGEVVILPHSPEHRATHAFDFDYNPALTSSLWNKFLRDVFTDVYTVDKDRQERIDLLEEFIGTCFLGEITRYEICLLLLGEEGANGKSTLLHVIRAMFGADAVACVSPELWGNPFYLADLVNARVNIVNELPEVAAIPGNILKQVISGDMQTASRKFKDPFKFCAEAGHIFACNELPATNDQSGGYWRRWAVLRFDRTFKETERDQTLRFKLVEHELPAIIARVILAAARLHKRRRFIIPESSAETKRDWQRLTNPVATFAESQGAKLFKDYQHGLTATQLYTAYCLWAKTLGQKQLTQTSFGRLAKSVFEYKRNANVRLYCQRLPDHTEPSQDQFTQNQTVDNDGLSKPVTNPSLESPANQASVTGVTGVTGFSESPLHTQVRAHAYVRDEFINNPSYPTYLSLVDKSQGEISDGLVTGRENPSRDEFRKHPDYEPDEPWLTEPDDSFTLPSESNKDGHT